jgi:adenylate cyclase
MEYTAIGDTVNIASRIESLTKLYGRSILLTDSVISNCDISHSFLEIDSVQLKGKSDIVTLYTLLDFDGEDSVTEADIYKTALTLYKLGKFDEAMTIFNSITSSALEKCANLLSERCVNFIKTPPHSEWAGITKLTEK